MNPRDEQASVLVLSSTLPRWADDAEPRFVLDLARSLAPRFRPVVLAPISPGAAALEVLAGVEVHRFRYAPFRSWEVLAAPGAILPNLRSRPWLAPLIPMLFLGQLVAVIRMLRRERFDVVHCHWIIPQGLTMAACSLLMRTPPFVVTCHGTDVYALNNRPFRFLKRAILRRARGVTVVSTAIARFLVEHIDHALAERIRRIPMGVDLNLFRARERVAEGRSKRILFAGRLSEGKGVEHLLHAIATPRLRAERVQLRIAGDGPARRSLESTASRLQITDRVDFLGAMPHSELAKEMAHAAIFCLPSVIDSSGAREGLPTVLLEASAARVPVIASDIGGSSDLIVTNETGWLVRAADPHAIAQAVIEAIDDPEHAARMATAAHDRVQEYSWVRVGDQFSELLHTLMHAEDS